MKARPTIAACLCLFFVAVLVWRLAGDGFDPNRLFGAADLANSPPPLDSFSEPSLGLAALQQEAEQLLIDYHENRKAEEDSLSAAQHDSAAIGRRAVPASASDSPAAWNSPAARAASALKRLAELRAEVHDLDIDLDWKLMSAYRRNDSPSDFLDCYLRTVHQAPDRPWVRNLASICAGIRAQVRPG